MINIKSKFRLNARERILDSSRVDILIKHIEFLFASTIQISFVTQVSPKVVIYYFT